MSVFTIIPVSLSQQKRTETYLSFESKQAAVLFATDIAARGLDFPEVDWVVQVDAPEVIALLAGALRLTLTSGRRTWPCIFIAWEGPHATPAPAKVYCF
jgi:late competence protein required for DNA uptake (superfamily II DNA/RNA helicase)